MLSDENYSNTEVVYQNLYFKLLSQINLEIKSKKNLFIHDPKYKKNFNSFYNKFIKKEYCLLHVDERWDQFYPKDIINTLNLIKTFHNGLEYYYNQKWDKAISQFNKSNKMETFNGEKDINPSKVFITRAREFKKFAPRKGCRGAFVLKDK